MPHQPSLASIDKKLAVICSDLQHQKEQQNKFETNFEKHLDQGDKRAENTSNAIGKINDCANSAKDKADINKTEINRLRNKSNVIDVMLAVASLILGALGINNK